MITSAWTGEGRGRFDPRWVVGVGDVAGKGLAAALMSAAVSPEIRHTVWSGAFTGRSPSHGSTATSVKGSSTNGS